MSRRDIALAALAIAAGAALSFLQWPVERAANPARESRAELAADRPAASERYVEDEPVVGDPRQMGK